MARITPTLGEITGSIGNLTFQKNFSGSIVRLRPRSGRSMSAKQYAAHQALQNSVNGWQNLSLANKDLWNTFAGVHTKTGPTGSVKKLTGFNWYTSINQNLGLISQPQISVPPFYESPPAVPFCELHLTPTQLLLEIGSDFDSDGNALLCFAYLPTNRVKGTMLNLKKLMCAVIASPPIENLQEEIICSGANIPTPFPSPYAGFNLTTDAGLELLTDQEAADYIFDLTPYWQTATKIIWNPEISFPTANIIISIQQIKKTSGISSAQFMIIKNASHLRYTSDSIYFF
jgi:hypothetical protein